jgi:hypothetical protein
MTGLKSGSGDDLWGDEDDEAADEPAARESDASVEGTDERADAGTQTVVEPSAESPTASASSESSTTDSSSSTARSGSEERSEQSYIVRRAIQDKSVQFEREERLTFFVHDDVVDGERELVSEMESELGRDVPKFDVREAVYRAALDNPDDVLSELLAMGYSLDEP